MDGYFSGMIRLLFVCDQPGDDNHELALEFCLHNVDFHRFADVGPKAVDEEYDRQISQNYFKFKGFLAASFYQLRKSVARSAPSVSSDAMGVHHLTVVCGVPQPAGKDGRQCPVWQAEGAAAAAHSLPAA